MGKGTGTVTITVTNRRYGIRKISCRWPTRRISAPDSLNCVLQHTSARSTTPWVTVPALHIPYPSSLLSNHQKSALLCRKNDISVGSPVQNRFLSCYIHCADSFPLSCFFRWKFLRKKFTIPWEKWWPGGFVHLIWDESRLCSCESMNTRFHNGSYGGPVVPVPLPVVSEWFTKFSLTSLHWSCGRSFAKSFQNF